MVAGNLLGFSASLASGASGSNTGLTGSPSIGSATTDGSSDQALVTSFVQYLQSAISQPGTQNTASVLQQLQTINTGQGATTPLPDVLNQAVTMLTNLMNQLPADLQASLQSLIADMKALQQSLSSQTDEGQNLLGTQDTASGTSPNNAPTPTTNNTTSTTTGTSGQQSDQSPDATLLAQIQALLASLSPPQQVNLPQSEQDLETISSVTTDQNTQSTGVQTGTQATNPASAVLQQIEDLLSQLKPSQGIAQSTGQDNTQPVDPKTILAQISALLQQAGIAPQSTPANGTVLPQGSGNTIPSTGTQNPTVSNTTLPVPSSNSVNNSLPTQGQAIQNSDSQFQVTQNNVSPEEILQKIQALLQPQQNQGQPTTPVASNSSQSSESSSQQTNALVNQLQSILEQAPPEAHQALKDVMDKLQQSTAAQPQPPLSSKTLQQIQLEISFSSDQGQNDKSSGGDTSPDDKGAFNLNDTNLLTLGGLSSMPDAQHLNTNNMAITDNNNSQVGLQSANIPPHEQILNATQVNLADGRQEITIQLKPEELGSVKITIQTNAQKEVSARIITETPEAKASLEKDLSQLTQSFSDNGIKIARLTIVHAGGDVSDSGNQNANQGSFKHHQNPDQTAMFQQQSQQQNRNRQFDPQDFLQQGSFTDDSSSFSGEETSSNTSFGTDAEGEEVLGTTSVSSLPPGQVDIKV